MDKSTENIKDVVRHKILNNQYCKFDLLDELLPLEYILRTKPIILRIKIAAILDIKPEKINPKAFNEWRRRLKQKESVKISRPNPNSIKAAPRDLQKLNQEFTPVPISSPKFKEVNADDLIETIKSSKKATKTT